MGDVMCSKFFMKKAKDNIVLSLFGSLEKNIIHDSFVENNVITENEKRISLLFARASIFSLWGLTSPIITLKQKDAFKKSIVDYKFD
jgi:hypothetical protein